MRRLHLFLGYCFSNFIRLAWDQIHLKVMCPFSSVAYSVDSFLELFLIRIQQLYSRDVRGDEDSRPCVSKKTRETTRNASRIVKWSGRTPGFSKYLVSSSTSKSRWTNKITLTGAQILLSSIGFRILPYTFKLIKMYLWYWQPALQQHCYCSGSSPQSNHWARIPFCCGCSKISRLRYGT